MIINDAHCRSDGAGVSSVCRVWRPQLRQALRQCVLRRLQLLLQTQHQEERRLRLHWSVATVSGLLVLLTIRTVPVRLYTPLSIETRQNCFRDLG